MPDIAPCRIVVRIESRHLSVRKRVVFTLAAEYCYPVHFLLLVNVLPYPNPETAAQRGPKSGTGRAMIAGAAAFTAKLQRATYSTHLFRTAILTQSKLPKTIRQWVGEF